MNRAKVVFLLTANVNGEKYINGSLSSSEVFWLILRDGIKAGLAIPIVQTASISTWQIFEV